MSLACFSGLSCSMVASPRRIGRSRTIGLALGAWLAVSLGGCTKPLDGLALLDDCRAFGQTTRIIVECVDSSARVYLTLWLKDVGVAASCGQGGSVSCSVDASQHFGIVQVKTGRDMDNFVYGDSGDSWHVNDQWEGIAGELRAELDGSCESGGAGKTTSLGVATVSLHGVTIEQEGRRERRHVIEDLTLPPVSLVVPRGETE